ncbi:MAG: cyclic nucleotide-binding domain-containing protein, partial [Methylococcaceae bacterium]|nr:cyclic nucleotide-binding domain-containing protein [Methylococcaceae bacterium]
MSKHFPISLTRRPPTQRELDALPWLHELPQVQQSRVLPSLVVHDLSGGEHLCLRGQAATYWFGVLDGLLKLSTDNVNGQSMTFAGVPPGGWFGEGTLLKRESYRYDVLALRRSSVAGLPIEVFHRLLGESLEFNSFVMRQLNEHLGQFMSALESG